MTRIERIYTDNFFTIYDWVSERLTFFRTDFIALRAMLFRVKREILYFFSDPHIACHSEQREETCIYIRLLCAMAPLSAGRQVCVKDRYAMERGKRMTLMERI